MQTFETPILLIIFNRPDRASKVLEEIRKIKPSNLYIAADGPRNIKEKILCDETRKVADRVDWNCNVYKKFNKENLGVKMGVVTAINWFFDSVQEGIILEDDCLPSKSFFKFCSLMLTKYRDDTRVFQICGTNSESRWKENISSYFFSYYGSIWGWATWKRAWKTNDINMKLWEKKEARKAIITLVPDRMQYIYRRLMYQASYEGKINAWSYAWSFARLINSGLSIVPSVNLIKNLGFGKDSSNTKSKFNAFSRLDRHELSFPLKEPDFVIADREFDRRYFLKLAVYSKFYSFLNLPFIAASEISKKLS